MSEEQTKEIDGLINCLDDLPHLMDKIKAETANTTRYSLTGPNYSYHVAMALNGQDPTERNAYQEQRMAFQTKKVLERLASLPKSNTFTQRTSIQKNARRVKETLLKYKNSGINLYSFYKQYDTTKSGAITYKDFSDILLSMGTGIGREDAMFLARSVDTNKTGSIHYNTLLSSLEKVETSPNVIDVPGTNNKSASSTSSRQSKSGGIDTYTYSNSEDIAKPLTEAKSVESNQTDSVPSDPSSQSKKVAFSESIDGGEASPVKRIISLNPNNSKINFDNEAAKVETAQDILNTEFGSTGRRFFWHNPKTEVTRSLQRREAPYQVELTLDQQKEMKKKRRSLSAPPRTSASTAPREAKNSLSDFIQAHDDALEASENNASSNALVKSAQISSSDIDLTNSASLRNAIERSKTGKIAKSVKKKEGLGLALKNPVTETRNLLDERSKLVEQTEKTILENNLIRQISGKYENLKHIMKQQDRSKSGTINLQEFKRSLVRLGIQLNNSQMETLFANYLTQTSHEDVHRQIPPKQHFIYNEQSNQSFFNSSSININEKEKVIPIDIVLDRLQQRARSTAFEHVRKDVTVHGEKLDTFLQDTEQLKISKKILNQMNKIPNPNRVFETLYPMNQGYLTIPQLTKSLQTMGTNIQPQEVEIITANLPKGPKGEISMNTFNESLLNQIQTISQKQDSNKVQHYHIHQHPRYGNTYRSSIQFGSSGNEFENIHHNNDTLQHFSQKERKDWSRLQSILQKNYSKILKAFANKPMIEALGKNANLEKQKMISNTIDEQHLLPSVSVEQLQKRLAKEGVLLGQEDAIRLQKQMYQKLHQENRLSRGGGNGPVAGKNEITIEDFCEVVGIPIRRNDAANRVELMDKHEARVSDVGTFEASRRSVHHNQTLSTSIHYENSDSVREQHVGKAKRKPQPIYMHSKEPSKFWEFLNSNDNPIAFPYPQTTFRPSTPLPTSNTSTVLAHLNKSEVRRGVVSVDDRNVRYGGQKLTMEALLKANNQPINRVVTSDGSFIINGGVGTNAIIVGGGGTASASGDNLRGSGAGINISQQSINLTESGSKDPIITMSDSMHVDASNLSLPSGVSPFVSSAEADRRQHHHRKGRKRSVSADPRSTSSQSSYSRGDESDGYSSAAGSNRSDKNDLPTYRIDANDLSQHIAKWSNATLADYYTKAISTGTGPAALVTGGKALSQKAKSTDHYDSQDSTISPSSYHSTSTISRGTVNFNKKPVAIMGGGGKKSVRDDFDSSAVAKTGAAAAPYANDLHKLVA